jgi:hypothetical protein
MAFGEPDLSPAELKARASALMYAWTHDVWLAAREFYRAEAEHREQELREALFDAAEHLRLAMLWSVDKRRCWELFRAWRRAWSTLTRDPPEAGS